MVKVTVPEVEGQNEGIQCSSVSSNLVLNTDEFLNIDAVNQMEVILKKCCCKCVWCQSCWEYFYVPKLRSFMEEMDYRRVRHITPTIARDQFNTLEEAYHLFNAGEFVSRLTRGKKKRVGVKWTTEYIFEPIQWKSYLWFVEFHIDGTAHFHLVLEVEKIGQGGMIGGDRLRYYWPYGRINEGYFETEKHWLNFMGYELNKGYASEEKAHQGQLPELLDQAGSKKLRRWGHSREKKEKTEEERFDELNHFFRRKGIESGKANNPLSREIEKSLEAEDMEGKRNKKRPYSVIMQECGTQTFMKLSIGKLLFRAIVNKPYREITASIEGKYVEKKGFVGSLTTDDLSTLKSHIIRIISSEPINSEVVRYHIKRRLEFIDRVIAVTGEKFRK